MQNDRGLKRALNPGDEVILSTGATATARGSYPEGYTGEVAVLLDGVDETERADALTLPDKTPFEIPPFDSDGAISVGFGETRAASRRMKD